MMPAHVERCRLPAAQRSGVASGPAPVGWGR